MVRRSQRRFWAVKARKWLATPSGNGNHEGNALSPYLGRAVMHSDWLANSGIEASPALASAYHITDLAMCLFAGVVKTQSRLFQA